MNANFKQLGLAAAVAAASAGYAGVVNSAAEIAGNQLGDMAVVPYYTVQGDFVTGVHVINTSDYTQVVKLRLRRATDSMDALDFNLIMSPKDEWTGFLKNDTDGGQITFNSADTTCTVPELINNQAPMPPIYNLAAETGYIEVIGMGAADPNQPIYSDSLHVAGVPVSCDRVRENFLADGVAGTSTGVINSTSSVQTNAKDALVTNTYMDASDSLKVSFFVRDGTAGVEFGSNATHFSGFMANPSITNQERGIFSGDLQGFDYPDLNGGAPLSVLTGVPNAATRGKFNEIRASIGGSNLSNDWSNASSDAGFTVGTDWVVTAPGQYTMLDLTDFIPNAIGVEEGFCTPKTATEAAVACDFRDIPLTASFVVYDREENEIVVDPGELVFSPTIPGLVPDVTLDKEVNVVQWADESVLDAPTTIVVPVPEGAVNGWASLTVAPTSAHAQSVCDFAPDPNSPGDVITACTPAIGGVPLVGFVAWQRSFSANPDANYGRIIDHSYTVSAP
ncbi:MAG: hypothetical protein ACI8QT_000496 [Halioglobus sp.]|jgi:hypothetical protein